MQLFPRCGSRPPDGLPENVEMVAGTAQKYHIFIKIISKSLLFRNLQLIIMLIEV